MTLVQVQIQIAMLKEGLPTFSSSLPWQLRPKSLLANLQCVHVENFDMEYEKMLPPLVVSIDQEDRGLSHVRKVGRMGFIPSLVVAYVSRIFTSTQSVLFAQKLNSTKFPRGSVVITPRV